MQCAHQSRLSSSRSRTDDLFELFERLNYLTI
jgi:hypothetical protein